MDFLSKNDLRALIADDSPHCVSILMPTMRGSDARQNHIRFRNLIQEAQDRLVDTGMRGTEAAALLEHGRNLLEDAAFWRTLSAGLAAYISPRIQRFFRLPVSLPQQVYVNGHFYIKPLLGLMSVDGPFYVLAVSQQHVRLLLCSRHVCQELPLAGTGVPANFAEATHFDIHEKKLQFHTQTPSAAVGARRAAFFFGQGGFDRSVHKADVVRYLRMIDTGLRGILHDTQAPIVFAGVEFLHGLFRSITGHPVVDRYIPGNHDRTSADELRTMAWQLVEQDFSARQRMALQQLDRAQRVGLASTDITDVVKAAHAGRVGVLFTNQAESQWGVFDPQRDQVRIHQQRRGSDADLTDYATVQTLLHGGEVFPVEPGKQPLEPVAAIYRY